MATVCLILRKKICDIIFSICCFQPMLDEEVRHLREQLWSGVATQLCKGQLYRYNVAWQPGGIDPDSHTDHKNYLDTLCQQFTNGVLHQLEKAKHLRKSQIPVSEYYTEFDELLHHMHFCLAKCADFRGQGETLQKIRDFLSVPKNNCPLVVFADSGVGKTSLMAMVMKLLPQWLGTEPGPE